MGQTLWNLYLNLVTRFQLVDYVKSSHIDLKILNKQGDLAITSRTKIDNTSAKTITWLPGETVRLDVDPVPSIPLRVVSITPGKAIKVAYLHKYEDEVGTKTVYANSWRPRVNPGIEKGQTFEHEWSINCVEKAEADTFRGCGDFHMRIRQYYVKVSADIVAPVGYRFSLSDHYVVDATGNRLQGETTEMSPPKLNETGTILSIEQNRPRPLTDYIYHYGLVAGA